MFDGSFQGGVGCGSGEAQGVSDLKFQKCDVVVVKARKRILFCGARGAGQ